MRKVERLKSGRYKVRYRMPGRETSQTFDRKSEATRFATLESVLGPARALAQLYEEKQLEVVPDLDALAADHIRLLTGVEPGTRLNYERLWARTWGPLIGKLPATQLTGDDIRAATNSLADRYSAKSLMNQRGLLAAVCDRAVDLKYLAGNPTKGLRLPRTGEVEKDDMRILTPDEFAGVLKLMSAHYRPFLRFLAGTGVRFGEAVAVQVGDVDLPNVRIRRALKWSPDNNRLMGPTKTKRGNRTIALPAEVQLDLGPLLADRPGDALIFTAPKGGTIAHRTFWSRDWLPAVQHLKPRPTIKDLRHTHASWLLAAGVPIIVVSRRLGHESITTTVNTYGHLLPDAQVAAAAAADAVFGVRTPELES